MSALLFGKAFKTQVGNACRKLVLLKLADNCNDQGECWPSYQHIADQCEMSRRSVINHINALSDLGFVEVCPRTTSKGSSSNKYRLNLPSENNAPLTNPKPVGGEVDAPLASESFAPLENKGIEGSEPVSPPSEIHSPPGAPDSLGSAGDSPGGSEPFAPRTYHSFESPNESIDGVVIESVPEQTNANDNAEEQHPVFLSDLNLTTAASLVNQDRFQMHFEWMPSTSFYERCRMQGIAVGNLSAEEQEIVLGEFRSYWEGRGDQLSQSGWEHKFTAQVKRALLEKASKQSGQLTPAETRRHVTAEVMNLNDTSWAE